MAALLILFGWLLAGAGAAFAVGRLVGRLDDEEAPAAEQDRERAA